MPDRRNSQVGAGENLEIAAKSRYQWQVKQPYFRGAALDSQITEDSQIHEHRPDVNNMTANQFDGENTEKVSDIPNDSGEEQRQLSEDPSEEVSAPGSQEIDELREKLQAAEQESLKHKDGHLRVLAEMENLKKRQKRELEDFHKFAGQSILNDLLPVLDSFDKALSSDDSKSNEESVLQGVQMVQKQLLAALEKHGLTTIPAEGAEFDPNLHQAIQRVESDDVAKEMVKQEFAKGYMLNGRLLRASMVSVAVPKS